VGTWHDGDVERNELCEILWGNMNELSGTARGGKISGGMGNRKEMRDEDRKESNFSEKLELRRH